MAIGPTISAAIHDGTTTDKGFYFQFYYFTLLCLVGCVANLWLIWEDEQTGAILRKVDKGKTNIDMITSPKPEERREIERSDLPQNVKDYRLDSHARDALKRSRAQVTK